MAGFSLAEVLATITVMGIMSAIMIKVFSNVKQRSSEIIATELLETVNQGLTKFNQGNYQITTAAVAGSGADEAEIIGLLQTRDVTIPGTPFLRADWAPIASSSAEEYRIRWAGRRFVLLELGEAGTGLKVNFQAEDYD